MDIGLAGRRRAEGWGRGEGLITSARPLIRPAPRSAMFFPLVVLVAVLPGLYALNWWDFTSAGAWWGVRAVAVLDGQVIDQASSATSAGFSPFETRAYLDVAYQPPLYAWLVAIGLALTPGHAPWASVVPSYAAGVLVVILVYLHGRLWRGPGVGLVAAVLTGTNRGLLNQMQQGSPATLGLAAAVAALYFYGRHLRGGPTSTTVAGAWNGGTTWLIAGGLALGLGLLAHGAFALIVLPVALLHQAYLVAEVAAPDRPIWRRLKLGWRDNPSLVAGAVVVAIGLAVAGPWYAVMIARHGRDFLDSIIITPDQGPAAADLLSRLVELAPATLPLGLYAAFRSIRRALVAEVEDAPIVGGVFWVFWLTIAALAHSIWPGGPRATFDLFLLLPLNLLAAQGMADLSHRVIPIRVLNVLAPITACCIAWWISGNLRGAVADLARGRASSATGLGLHLALDLLIGAFLFTRLLERWARRRDDRQRRVLATFLGVVMVTTVAGGLTKIAQGQPPRRDYLELRDAILSRHRDHPFAEVDVVAQAASTSGGQLRFILRSTLPHLTYHNLSAAKDLLALAAPAGPRLVVCVGGEHRLSKLVQSRLSIEAIYSAPSGLDAFASTQTVERKR